MKYLGVGIVLCAINLMAWFSKDKMNSMDDYNFPTYEKEWKKIEENLKSGLYKSALPEIESVLQKSISDKIILNSTKQSYTLKNIRLTRIKMI